MQSNDVRDLSSSVAENDNDHMGMIGTRLELVGGFGSVVYGRIDLVTTNRWGTSCRVALEDGGQEWVSLNSIRRKGTRGVGVNLAAE